MCVCVCVRMCVCVYKQVIADACLCISRAIVDIPGIQVLSDFPYNSLSISSMVFVRVNKIEVDVSLL